MTGSAPYLQTYWDWRAAGNFMFGGTGSGALIITAFVALDGGPVWLFTLAGLGAIGLGLCLVWHEIGKRLRALNVFRHPHLSWMTRESFAAMATFLAGGASLLWGGAAFAFIAGLCALVFLYCQGRILLASKGIPAWREKTALPLIMTTGIVEGLSVVVMAALTLPLQLGESLPVPGLSATFVNVAGLALGAGLIARYLVWRRYLANFGKSAPEKALQVYDRFMPYFLIGGHALPFVLAGAALPVAAFAAPGLALAGLAALAGGWALKFTMIARASYTQGFAIPHRPARGPRGSGGPGVKPGWTQRS